MDNILVLDINEGIFSALNKRGHKDLNLILVKPGRDFKELGDQIFEINPEKKQDYQLLMDSLYKRNLLPLSNTETLACYIIRAPFSQERLTYIPEESKVIYKSKDGKGQIELDPLEWLAALCSHVPDKFEQTVHYYGFYSNKMRGQRIKDDTDSLVPRMAEITKSMIGGSLDAFIHENTDLAQKVRKDDEDVNEINKQLFRKLLTYMMEDPRTIHRATTIIQIAKNLERISDHAKGIASMVVYMVTGKSIRHE